MKSKKKIEKRIAEAKRQRGFADSCVEQTLSGPARQYWEQRVHELTQQIWELEWVLS